MPPSARLRGATGAPVGNWGRASDSGGLRVKDPSHHQQQARRKARHFSLRGISPCCARQQGLSGQALLRLRIGLLVSGAGFGFCRLVRSGELLVEPSQRRRFSGGLRAIARLIIAITSIDGLPVEASVTGTLWVSMEPGGDRPPRPVQTQPLSPHPGTKHLAHGGSGRDEEPPTLGLRLSPVHEAADARDRLQNQGGRSRCPMNPPMSGLLLPFRLPVPSRGDTEPGAHRICASLSLSRSRKRT